MGIGVRHAQHFEDVPGLSGMRIGPVALRRSIPDTSEPIEPSFQCAIQIYTRFQPEKSIRENLERILGPEFSDTLLAHPTVQQLPSALPSACPNESSSYSILPGPSTLRMLFMN